MSRAMKFALVVVVAFASVAAIAQQSASNPEASQSTATAPRVSLSGETTNARFADPNELVAVNGRMVKMADLLRLVVAKNSSEQRPHIQETKTP